MTAERIALRVGQLLADAELARDAGERDEVHALATAVLALDPGNRRGEALLDSLSQRSQMTLMFCDLVGSTPLADTHDLETMSDILRAYRGTCTEVIERFGGYVEDRKGDGLLVRFGYPWVHEDDARRAVLSGLEIVRAMRHRNERRGPGDPPEMHLRIAVHTGVVVLDGGEVVGTAPNEAARLQGLAKPDTVIISGTTEELVSGYFDLESMGAVRLRGVAREIDAYTVVGERAVARLDAEGSLTPFAGRAEELVEVQRSWHAARAAWEHERGGDSWSEPPTAVLVSGVGGIGKSRLAREALASSGAPHLAGHCSSYRQTTSLHAFRRVLESICEIGDGDGPHERLAKLRAALAVADTNVGDLPLLAAALSIPAALLSPPAEIDPAKLRDLALASAATLVRSCAAQRPTVLLVDDLHWIDDSSADLISVLLSAPCPGLLLLLTARPEFAAPWPVVRIELGPLPATTLEEIARTLPAGAALDSRLREDLIRRSDGVPLFLEELIRTGAAIGRGPEPTTIREPDDHIPAALRDPLLARLVMPGVDLGLAQTAATIGRDVDRELLRLASGLDDKPFQAKLANLVAVGLVDRSDDATISFRHDLIREVAYQTQRVAPCRERHSLVADLLRTHDVSGSGDAAQLAFHLEHASRPGEAVAAYLDVARGHQDLGAHKEALVVLTHMLVLVEALHDPARSVTELTVRHLRSFSAIMAGGYSAPETAVDHARCVELCELLGLGPELLPSLVVSLSYYSFRGDLAEAARVCETMRRVVDELGGQLPASEFAQGVVSFFQGRLDEATVLMETFLEHAWASSPGAPPADWPMPNDPFAAISAHLLVALWLRGEPQAAQARADAALARVAGLRFPFGPFSACYVKSQLAVVRRLEGDHAGAAAIAAEMIELGDRHGFVLWTLAGFIQAQITEVHLGQPAALEPLVMAIGQWRTALSAELWTPYWLTELAAAQLAAGRPDEARASLDEALEVAALTGSDFFSAETLRLRGELRCRDGDLGGLDDLRGASEKAGLQGAIALQARAARSLALEQGRSLAAP